MYERLNGSFFLKVLFSHMTEGQKLKIAKYNKSLQETLERRLIHYKNFSQRYIINQSNGKGKEFNGFNGELLYEGDYKNGERNGKGKEYNSKGYVIFEGEYKNGKRNGKGKELINNKDLFKGEYINNKKISGVLYIQKSNKKYLKKEVKYSKELKNGKVKEYNIDGEFECEYVNGERNGKGKEYDKHTGITFEGIYLNGKKWEGKGYDSLNNIIYELNGGKGFVKEYIRENNLISECEYKNGLKNGKGKEYIYDDNGGTVLLYEGKYLNGLKNGKGKEYINDKIQFEGEFYNNHRLKGKYYMDGKLEYEGVFLFGKKWDGKGYDEKGNIIYELHNGTGKVKEFDTETNIIFEGEYLNGLYNGKGKEYDMKGKLLFEGEYKNGKRNGKGKEYGFSSEIMNSEEYISQNVKICKTINDNDEGKLIFEGEYKNGKRNGKGKEYSYSSGIISEAKYEKGKGWIITTGEFNDNGKLFFEGEYIDGERVYKK